MKPVEIKPHIYWVGGIDWDLRNFHGYLTQRGSSYNAYLIVDEKVVLVDTVKRTKYDEMLLRIGEIVSPSDIDIVVCNHVEMDHSGSLLDILTRAENARIITSPQGQKGIQRHFKKQLDYSVVKSGDTMNIGSYNLRFLQTPMVHWPDSMATYVPETKLLLPNDAFGQHIATPARFDDEIGWDIAYEEAAKYYANIVLPYGEQVQKTLDALAELDIDMIAPSHGIIWKTYIAEIVNSYRKWSENITDEKALIVYDSMWGSTEKMAHALQRGLEWGGVPVVMSNLKYTHISDVMTEVLRSRLVLVGSPTLNSTILPTVSAFLSYLGGLAPTKRIGYAFGSYGWGGQGVKQIEGVLKDMQWQIPLEGKSIRYVPDEEELTAVSEDARTLAKILQES